MSLGITINLNNGVSVSYWVISLIRMDLIIGSVVIDLEGYIDITYFGVSQPVTTLSVPCTGDIKTMLIQSGALTKFYQAVQSNDALFTSAVLNSDGN